MIHLVFNLNKPRSDLYSVLSEHNFLHTYCFSLLSSSPKSKLVRFLSAFISIPYVLFLLLYFRVFHGSCHLILMTQPPLLQPIFGFFATSLGHSYSIYIYDNYLPFVSRSPFRSSIFRVVSFFWIRFFSNSRTIWTLSNPMAKYILQLIPSDPTKILVNPISSHIRPLYPSRPVVTSNSPSSIYDLIAIGSFSRPHSIEGLCRLFVLSEYTLRLHLSSQHYLAFKSCLSTRYGLDANTFSSISCFGFLSAESLAITLSKSAFGFASLRPDFNNVCFPSKIYTYMLHQLPVLFDGDSDVIDIPPFAQYPILSKALMYIDDSQLELVLSSIFSPSSLANFNPSPPPIPPNFYPAPDRLFPTLFND